MFFGKGLHHLLHSDACFRRLSVFVYSYRISIASSLVGIIFALFVALW